MVNIKQGKSTGIDENVTVHEYTLQLDNESVLAFVDDKRIIAAGRKTDCDIRLTNRILNRPCTKGRLVKHCIVRIVGKDDASIARCNRLLERILPDYVYRKRYYNRAPLTIYTKEFLPDNSDVYYCPMRTGAFRNCFGNVPLKSPHNISAMRPIGKTPWKISADERLGNYDPSHLLDILAYYKPGFGAAFGKVPSQMEFDSSNVMDALTNNDEISESSDQEKNSDDDEREDDGSNDVAESSSNSSESDKESDERNHKKENINKDTQNDSYGKLFNMKTSSMMTQKMLEHLPKGLSEPLVILVEGNDIMMAGSAAVKMNPHSVSGGMEVDVCAAKFKIRIEGDNVGRVMLPPDNVATSKLIRPISSNSEVRVML